jgi:hypothetical protein
MDMSYGGNLMDRKIFLANGEENASPSTNSTSESMAVDLYFTVVSVRFLIFVVIDIPIRCIRQEMYIKILLMIQTTA